MKKIILTVFREGGARVGDTEFTDATWLKYYIEQLLPDDINMTLVADDGRTMTRQEAYDYLAS